MNDGGPLDNTDVAARTHTTTYKPKALTHWACDECFVQKAKCITSNDRSECDRCRRLLKPCVSNRPIRQVGRRRLLPPSKQHDFERKAEPSVPYSLHPFGVLFKKLRPHEEQMLHEFTKPSNFQILMVVPRLGTSMHQQAMHTFFKHYDEMNHGCFSMYGAFAASRSMTLPGYDAKANLRRGALALRKWCAMSCPQHMEDFAPWLWSGLTVIVFAHCALGSSAAPVRR